MVRICPTDTGQRGQVESVTSVPAPPRPTLVPHASR